MSGTIPIIQIREASVCIYQEPIFTRRHCNNVQSRLRMHHARKKTYTGEMTSGSRKRLAKAVTLMCQATEPKWITNTVTGQMQYHRMTFITLTVASSRNISAKAAYPILLKPFIRWMREVKGVKMYVWKAELQQRGQIHYHITCPDFIHYMEVKNKWNGLQREAGLLEEYAKKHNHYNAPSTDVHETRSIKDMSSYMVKELGKTVDARKLYAKRRVEKEIEEGTLPEQARYEMMEQYAGEELKTEGKIWGCSENLEGASYFSIPLRGDVAELLMAMSAAGEVREVKGDFWSLIYLSDKAPPELLNDAETKLFKNHLRGLNDALDPEDITKWIPAHLVSPAADKEKEMSWQQLSMYLN